MDLPPRFAEGVIGVLSRWEALQTAVEREWGGRESRGKAEALVSDVVGWFSGIRVPHHHIDDLENMLDENMVLSFNAVIEDGSIEEVAEQLVIIYEDCVQSNYASVDKLSKLNPEMNNISKYKNNLKSGTVW